MSNCQKSLDLNSLLRDRLDGSRPAPDQKSFLTFGDGPRFCPGRNLAFLKAKTALGMIARNFEIELDPGKGTRERRCSHEKARWNARWVERKVSLQEQ